MKQAKREKRDKIHKRNMKQARTDAKSTKKSDIIQLFYNRIGKEKN